MQHRVLEWTAALVSKRVTPRRFSSVNSTVLSVENINLRGIRMRGIREVSSALFVQFFSYENRKLKKSNLWYKMSKMPCFPS